MLKYNMNSLSQKYLQIVKSVNRLRRYRQQYVIFLFGAISLISGDLFCQVTVFGTKHFRLSIDKIHANDTWTESCVGCFDTADEISFDVFIFDGDANINIITGHSHASDFLLRTPYFLTYIERSQSLEFHESAGRMSHSNIGLFNNTMGEGLKRIYLVRMLEDDVLLGAMALSIENNFGYFITEWANASIEENSFGSIGQYSVSMTSGDEAADYSIQLKVEEIE